MADNELLLRIGVQADTRSLSSINKEMNALSKANKGLNNQLKQTGSSLDAYKQKQLNLTRELELASAKQEKYKKTLADIRQKMADNRRQVEELKSSTGDHAEEISKLDAQYEKLTGQFNTTNAAIQQTQSQINSLNNELQQTNVCVEKFGRLELSEKFKGWSDSLSSFSEKAKLIGDSLSSIGSAGLKIFTPLDTALVGCAKSFMGFEQGVAKVNSIAKVSNSEIKNYSDGILELSNNSGTAVNDLTEATYQAISAGIDYKDSTKFVEDANKLAVAGFTDTTSAVDLLTTTINAYGLSADEATNISDVLIQTQNLGKTTVNELAQNMGNIIPIAKAMGVSYDEVCGSLVLLTKQGISTAEGSTMLTRLFDELGDSGSKVGEIIKEKTGKSFQELQAEGANTGDVLKILQEYSESTGIGLNEIFSSSEALQGALALLNPEAGDLAEIMLELTGNAGATDEAFNTVTGTAQYKMQKAFNELKNSLIRVGEALTPFVEKFADGLSKVADAISNLSAEQVQSIAKFALYGTAISGVIKIAGGFCSSLSSIAETGSKAFKWVSEALDPTKNLTTQVAGLGTSAAGASTGISGIGTAASGATALLNPLTLGIGAVVAAIAAIGVAWYNNEKKCEAGAKQLQEAGFVAEDLTGKVKGTKNALDRLFGHEYNIKFSDGYKIATQQIEEDVQAWHDRLAELQKNIDEILNNTEIDQETKQEQVKGLVQPWIDELNQGSEDITEKQKNMWDSVDEYAAKTFGRGSEGYKQVMSDYESFSNAYLTQYDADKQELLTIYEGLCSGEIQMTDELEAHILDIRERMANSEKMLSMESAEDFLSQRQLDYEKEAALEKGRVENIKKATDDIRIAKRKEVADWAEQEYKKWDMQRMSGAITQEEFGMYASCIEKQKANQLALADVTANSYSTMALSSKEFADAHGLHLEQAEEDIEGLYRIVDENGNALQTVFANSEEALQGYADAHGTTCQTITDENGVMTQVVLDQNGNVIAQLADNNWAWENNAQAVCDALKTEIDSVKLGSKTTDQAMEVIKSKLASGEISAQQFGFTTEEAFLECAREALNCQGDVDALKRSVGSLPKTTTVTVTDNGTVKDVQWKIDGIHGKSVTVTVNQVPGTVVQHTRGGSWTINEQGTHGQVGQEQLARFNESWRGSKSWELIDGPYVDLGYDGQTSRALLGVGASIKSNATSTDMMLKAVQEEVQRQFDEVYLDYAISNSAASKLAFNFGNPQQVINNNSNYDDSGVVNLLMNLLNAVQGQNMSPVINLDAKSIAKATYKYTDKFIAQDMKRNRY